MAHIPRKQGKQLILPGIEVNKRPETYEECLDFLHKPPVKVTETWNQDVHHLRVTVDVKDSNEDKAKWSRDCDVAKGNLKFSQDRIIKLAQDAYDFIQEIVDV